MRRVRSKTAVALLVGGLAVAALSRAEEKAAASAPEPKAAFERLKALAGEWDGTAETKDGPAVRVQYRVTAAGSAVVETLFAGTEHEMVSVYHMDGADLVMTHYCAAGNQPRMRFDRKTSSAGELRFAFDGGTNMDAARDTHIHGGRLRLVAADRLEEEWAMFQGGKEATRNKLFLSRKAPAE